MKQMLVVTKAQNEREGEEKSEVKIIIEPDQPPTYQGIEDFEAKLTGTSHWSGWLDAKENVATYSKPKESEFELEELVEFMKDAGFEVLVVDMGSNA